MSAHAIGSANVSFGLVSVPVKMFSTGESSAAISFNWLHKKDNARLKQEYVCSKDGEKVEKDDRIKGWEYTKGRYVTFTVEEIKALEEKGTGAIDIREFISADKVDRIYYDRAYFLGPDKGGERAYALLSKALTTTNLVALGQYVTRGKQYLIMVRPLEDGLVMEQLRYADEVRSIKDVELPKTEVKSTELDMAVQLIKQLTAEAFRPETYEDVAKKRIMEQIQRKIDGKEITEEPTEAPKTQIIDLMEALKASIAQGKDVDAAPKKKAKRTA
jgi:DNA end-binding protein Ku